MSLFVMLAGGTGGHLFPAEALAAELGRRGHDVHLITEDRASRFESAFAPGKVHLVKAATPSVRNPVKFLGAGFTILGGTFSAFRLLRKLDPDAVVGFGGYPTVPPFLAAALGGYPGIIHEANAVLGRANHLLARFADALALGLPNTGGAERYKCPQVITGNPVRDKVLEQASRPFVLPGDSEPIRLVVFGGSQGARFFSEAVPPAVAKLPAELRSRLRITQQCREEDIERVTRIYADARVNVELGTFFADLPARMASSHLVIARAGASSVAELGVLGRPSYLVPYPGALDHDQRANAATLADSGAAIVREQDKVSPNSLATELAGLLDDPARLAHMAAMAKAAGRPGAVAELANLTEAVAARHKGDAI